MTSQQIITCCDCRFGEHDNYDDRVKMVTVQDPETGRSVRDYLCEHHREMYAVAGYTVTL